MKFPFSSYSPLPPLDLPSGYHSLSLALLSPIPFLGMFTEEPLFVLPPPLRSYNTIQLREICTIYNEKISIGVRRVFSFKSAFCAYNCEEKKVGASLLLNFTLNIAFLLENFEKINYFFFN